MLRTLTRMLAVAAAVAASSCGGPTGSSSDEPSALTRDQYQASLDVAAGQLQDAMRGVKTARTSRGLASRLKSASRQLRAAGASLRKLPAPTAAATANSSLVEGLDDLAGQASINDEVCGGASAVTELSRTAGARRIRSASRALASLGYRTRRLTVRRRPQSSRSLANGRVIARSGAGSGALRVANGGSSDAVLKLSTSRRRTILGIYVRAGRTAAAGGIPTGTFRVLFASGRDWDPAKRGFTRKCQFTRFEGDLHYRPGLTYTLTLTPTAGGNASTQSIDESEFLGH